MNEASIDRWFNFVEDYYKDNSVPLSCVLCPNAYGYKTVGSPYSFYKGTRREWRKIVE